MILQASGFLIFTIRWSKKMATTFVDGHVEDLKYDDLRDDDTDKQNGYCNIQFSHETSQSRKSRVEFHGLVIFQYIIHEKFSFQCWLVIEFVSNCFVIRNIFYHIVHLFVVTVRLTRNRHKFLFFECFYSLNFVL